MIDIPGWFNFQIAYDKAVAELACDGANFVEVGAWLGKSAAYMANNLRGKNVNFWVVDTWAGNKSEMLCFEPTISENNGDVFPLFLKNMVSAGVIDMIRPIKMDSVVAASCFPDGFFDFIFIDADHTYDAVKADILAWSPKLKAGKVLAGDDYTELFPGVRKAVDEILPVFELMHYGTYWTKLD